MQIATPVSTLFDDPVAAAEIVSLSDCLECRERNLHHSYLNEHLLHADSSLIIPWSRDMRGRILKMIRLKSDLKLISFHAASCFSDPILKDSVFIPGGKPMSASQMLSHAIRNVKWLRSILKKGVDIALENNNYFPTRAYEIVTEGEFLNQIITETNIKLLYDIAHGKITCHNLDIHYEDYLNSLPLHKTVQLHLSRPDLSNRSARDAHELPDNQLFEEVQSLTEKYPIRYLTVEYYRDKEGLLSCLKKLKTIVNSHGPRFSE